MKANISQQGLNLADLFDHTISITSMVTPTLNATSEDSAYYNVTEPILYIINATENLVDMDHYASSSTTYSPPTQSTTTAVTIDPVTLTGSEEESASAKCFQIMVDCAVLDQTTEASTVSSTTTTTTPTTTTVFLDEEIYEDDYDNIVRSKRQIRDRFNTITATASPSGNKTTPQSIGRLLDSLNSILRGLKRNTTTRFTASLTTIPVTTTMDTTTASTSAAGEKEFSTSALTSSTPESLEDLIRWHTAGLQITTEEESNYDDDDDVSSSSIFDVIGSNGTDPVTDTTDRLDSNVTMAVPMCPLVVCPWNGESY